MTEPVMCCVRTLPPGLQVAQAMIEAEIKQLNDRLANLERAAAFRRDDSAWQAKWQDAVTRLGSWNEVLQLLQVPIVRMTAHERHRALLARVQQHAAHHAARRN